MVDVSRMVLKYLLAQRVAVDVGVNLGRADALVPQHGLYCAQVGAAFEQRRGEAVAQGVGADGLLYAGFGAETLDYD